MRDRHVRGRVRRRLNQNRNIEPRKAQRALWYAWNAGDPEATAEAWPAYRASLPALGVLSRAWARALSRQPDLASGLVKYCESRL